MADTKALPTNFGAPLADNQHSLTAGERGSVLLQDYLLIEKLAHFDRERIPERVVHAKGAVRQIGHFLQAHEEYGSRVAEALGIPVAEVRAALAR